MISTDTLEQNTAFAKQENADFPLIADPTQQTANKYGVLRDYGGDLGKLAKRSYDRALELKPGYQEVKKRLSKMKWGF